MTLITNHYSPHHYKEETQGWSTALHDVYALSSSVPSACLVLIISLLRDKNSSTFVHLCRKCHDTECTQALTSSWTHTLLNWSIMVIVHFLQLFEFHLNWNGWEIKTTLKFTRTSWPSRCFIFEWLIFPKLAQLSREILQRFLEKWC